MLFCRWCSMDDILGGVGGVGGGLITFVVDWKEKVMLFCRWCSLEYSIYDILGGVGGWGGLITFVVDCKQKVMLFCGWCSMEDIWGGHSHERIFVMTNRQIHRKIAFLQGRAPFLRMETVVGPVTVLSWVSASIAWHTKWSNSRRMFQLVSRRLPWLELRPWIAAGRVWKPGWESGAVYQTRKLETALCLRASRPWCTSGCGAKRCFLVHRPSSCRNWCGCWSSEGKREKRLSCGFLNSWGQPWRCLLIVILQ